MYTYTEKDTYGQAIIYKLRETSTHKVNHRDTGRDGRIQSEYNLEH